MKTSTKISHRKAQRIVNDAFEFLTKLNIKFVEFMGRQAGLGFETNAVADQIHFYDRQWKEYLSKRSLSDKFKPIFLSEADKIVKGFINKQKELENEKIA